MGKSAYYSCVDGRMAAFKPIIGIE